MRQKYDWEPEKFTLQGDAQINEATLGTLPYPEAQKLARSFMLQKRLGQLSDGKNGWMRLVGDDGKLRHTINPNGLDRQGQQLRAELAASPHRRLNTAKSAGTCSGQLKATR